MPAKSNASFYPATRLVIWPILALCGCTTTTILDSNNPSKNRPPDWPDYWSLPVDVHGSVPGVCQARLAAMFPPGAGVTGLGRRVVLYLNPAGLPPDAELCSRSDQFSPGGQAGHYAYLVGALCNGGTVVTYATANILSTGITPAQVGGHLAMMHLQLWQALKLGNNHPEKYFSGQMYGP